VTTFFTLDRANARIPEVRELLLLLRAQRDELIDLRDRLIALDAGTADDPGGDAAAAVPGSVGDDEEPARPDRATEAGSAISGLEEAGLIRLRIQGIVDQMGASVARIDAWGITLRDIESGLIDFPALVGGRQIWLCWRLGEDDVAWWHELDTGLAGRRPLAELEVGGGVH
jgi:hypothetical protein